MREVTISKDKLLKKLRENKDKHAAIFEEALEGWKKRVIEEIEKSLEDARAGRKFRTLIRLPQPENHVRDYASIIEQVEWHEAEVIVLDFRQFERFVRDNWGWTDDFLRTSSPYSSSASAALAASRSSKSYDDGFDDEEDDY